jgi:lipid A ethanolaminephosphotransferase
VRNASHSSHGSALYTSPRRKWLASISCPSAVVFAVSVSLLWTLFYNLSFWRATIAAMWHPTIGAAIFMASLFVLVLTAQTILLLLFPTRALRAVASALFVVAALSSYFCNTYGVIMNKDMMRNALQTDAAEVSGLLTTSLVAHVILLGLIPAVLVWRVRLPSTGWRTQVKQRAGFVVAALALSVAGLFASSANYAVFLREHKPIRYTLNPVAPISSLASLLGGKDHRAVGLPLLDPAGAVRRVAPPHAKPLVVFLVIGETARSANFQLSGYSRPTNPRLGALDDLVYFPHALSCGTSTAISVPCIFSHLGRDQFVVDEADRNLNLLDTLAQAGLEVEWRDNNAGCKGVCARVARQVGYGDRRDPDLCAHSYCYDEIMLTDLSSRLATLTRDSVIVFHQIGSHGPAYSERYPPAFDIFKPACRSNELQRCTTEEITNAYDNTIAYTDHVLAKQIELLRAAADRVDSVLLYSSDHGESLGEQGVYLHGLPYRFAPRTQKEVPMLLWTSPGYAERAHLRPGCLMSQAGTEISHDNIYHTVLGAAEVRDEVYDARLDILSACRVAPPSAGTSEAGSSRSSIGG